MPEHPMRAVTEKQRELLQYLIAYICEHGYQPSRAEMAAFFGVTKTAIRARLVELEERGVLSTNEGRERAICIRHVRFSPVVLEQLVSV